MPRMAALQDVIGKAPFGRFHVLLVALTTLVIMSDGYDAVSIGFAAPRLADVLGVPVASFGPIFGSGLLGLLLGSILLGPLANRFGCKTIMLVSIIVYGIFTLMPIFDLSIHTLLAYRFITGLGLGGAMPCAIALTTEYLPQRQSAFYLNLMLAGFPLGAVLGGIISSALVGSFGWPVIFVVGGVLPLLLLPLIAMWIPESLSYILAHPKLHGTATALLHRIDPSCRLPVAQIALPGSALGLLANVGGLFMQRRTASTLLLWLANFCCLFILFFINNWLPAMMTNNGVSFGRAILGPAMMNLGGVLGGIVLGGFISRYGPYRPLTVAMLAGAICVALLGRNVGLPGLALGVAFATGMLIDGVQLSLNALAARFYPAALRATGIGWALAVGRIGSVLGPISGGLMLIRGWHPAGMFLGVSLPAIIGAFAILTLGRLHQNQVKADASALPAITPAG